MLKGTRAVIIRNAEVFWARDLKENFFYGLWCTFGGAVEPGETPEQALKRELKEELGIDITEPEFLTVIETVAEDDPGETVQLHYFLVRRWKGEIVNKSEHSEIRWFSMEELENLDMGWAGKAVMKQYMTRSK